MSQKMDDLDPKSFTIVHRTRPNQIIQSQVEELSKWEKEIELKRVVIPTNKLIFSSVSDKNNIEMQKYTSELEYLRNTCPNISLGVELTSECLEMLSHRPISFDHTENVINSFLSELHSKGLMNFLVIACNGFTVKTACTALDWARKHSVVSIGADILRAHSRSPGLLISPRDVPARLGSRALLENMEEALRELKQVLDICMKIESKHLTDVSKLKADMERCDE